MHNNEQRQIFFEVCAFLSCSMLIVFPDQNLVSYTVFSFAFSTYAWRRPFYSQTRKKPQANVPFCLWAVFEPCLKHNHKICSSPMRTTIIFSTIFITVVGKRFAMPLHYFCCWQFMFFDSHKICWPSRYDNFSFWFFVCYFPLARFKLLGISKCYMILKKIKTNAIPFVQYPPPQLVTKWKPAHDTCAAKTAVAEGTHFLYYVYIYRYLVGFFLFFRWYCIRAICLICIVYRGQIE